LVVAICNHPNLLVQFVLIHVISRSKVNCGIAIIDYYVWLLERAPFVSEVVQAAGHSTVISPHPSRIWKALWWFMVLSCIGVSVYSTRYLITSPVDQHFARYIFPLRLHIAGGIGALLAGPWQFSRRLRTRALNFHRWLGRFYLLEVGLGSIAGLTMATVSEGGLPTHLGFGLLAILWFLTGLQAYRAIKRGQVSQHRAWMIRNFALTLAAVTLRHYMPLMLFGLHWSFRSSYIAVSWLCWVPNLFAAEWLVRRDTHEGTF
jgi:uncharacterized membrane protein